MVAAELETRRETRRSLLRGPPFRVGPWTVDPRSGEISRHVAGEGHEVETIRLGPKVTAVLVCLAERAGDVVSKDELIAHAWDGAPFTSDEALAAVLYELRKALDDDARRPRFIETLRGSGYRLIAPVEQAGELGPQASLDARGNDPASTSRRDWKITAGLAALLLLGLLLVWMSLRPDPPPGSPDIRSLAVLPVTTFTPGAPMSLATGDPLSTVLTEMLTADLAQCCTQDVTPGITLRGFEPREPGDRWRLDQVEEVLGVDAVVEGSVLRSGDHLWISLQLVETASGRMLWSGSWDRELGDELLVLREVALEAAREIRSALGAGSE